MLLTALILIILFVAPLYIGATPLLCILLLPFVVQLLGQVTTISNGALCALFAVLLVASALWNQNKLSLHKPKPQSIVCTLILLFGIHVFYHLCLLWPDFVSMGERLRDYAILATTIEYPLDAKEPWMAGVGLNYYLFWYRLGAVFSSFLSLPAWDTYHFLVAFTYALYFSSVLRLLWTYFGFSFVTSLGGAILICFGSNISGVSYFILQDPNWWGPSRVIEGSITEFSVWSFLLGDVHPHFLNLGLAPFLISIAIPLFNRSRHYLLQAGLFICCMGAFGYWLYCANAWELPVWALFFGCIVVAYAIIHWGGLKGTDIAFDGIKSSFKTWIGLIAFPLFLYACYLSSRNILPTEQPLTVVLSSEPSEGLKKFIESLHLGVMVVPRTSVKDLALHWGFPLGLMVLSYLLLISKKELKLIFLAVLVGACVWGYALPVLIVLLITAIAIASIDFRKFSQTGYTSADIVIRCLGIAALLAIMFPEFLFFNDSYGGENERMNTIFKFYSAAWFAIHLYAFHSFKRIWHKIPSALRQPLPVGIVSATTAVLLCGFFYRTIPLRMSTQFGIKPISQGLSALNQQYPGAGPAIQALEKAPRGVVLEGQGPPYSNTTHVATLTGNIAFLGWSNHVGLLTRKYDEVSKREAFTDQIYNENDCGLRAQSLKEAGIRYIVVGFLEKGKYQDVDKKDFSCFEKIVEAENYKIYSPGSPNVE